MEGETDTILFSDYKECEGDVSSCDLHAHCYEFTDRLSFGCQCKEGFQGNGFKCQESKISL